MKPKYDLTANDYPYKSQRARVSRLIAEGLCTACGRVPPRDARRYCAVCAAKNAERNLRLHRLALECGVCIQCRKKPATRGTRMCTKCRVALNATKGAAKKAARLAAPCPKCGGSRAKGCYGQGYCRACSLAVETSGERARRLVAEGRCQHCAEPRGASGFAVYCKTCGLRHRESAREWHRINRVRKPAEVR